MTLYKLKTPDGFVTASTLPEGGTGRPSGKVPYTLSITCARGLPLNQFRQQDASQRLGLFLECAEQR